MILDQRVRVPASLDDAWAFLMDIPAVSSCVPGVESMEPLDDDRFNAVMKVKLGSIRIRFEGTITVLERNRGERRARLLAEGADRRVGGSVKAQVDMRLEPFADGLEMVVHTDAAVLGKLGELGQAVMRRKSDQVMEQFAANMRARLGGEGANGQTPASAAPSSSAAAAPDPSVSAPHADAPSDAPAPASPSARATPPTRWARLGAWLRQKLTRR